MAILDFEKKVEQLKNGEQFYTEDVYGENAPYLDVLYRRWLESAIDASNAEYQRPDLNERSDVAYRELTESAEAWSLY